MTLDELREAVELARAAWQRAVLTGTQEEADAAYRLLCDCRERHLDAYKADLYMRLYDNVFVRVGEGGAQVIDPREVHVLPSDGETK